jgi:phosphoribosylformylglycinamidine synthase
MASKGGAGIRLDMNKVPCRETGMTPYEMMLSESQERMLMVLKPGREPEAEAIFRKWELDFAVIGEVTDTGNMVLEFDGEVVCDIPLGPLADEAPCYERPYISQDEYKAWAGIKPLEDVPESTDIAADLLKLMASPNIASRRWIWEQYDSQVGGDTVQRPGGDAAVVRVHGTKKALAITTDCTPRYVYADPVEGGKQAVAETYRNLCAVGAKPLAITNCLNFGNPQRPEIMAQLVGALQGMGEACRALDYPIVSGNVSLYNESKATGGGSAILPTPAIGGVGLLDDWEKSATLSPSFANAIFLIGLTQGHLGQSLWLREVHGKAEGTAPQVDLETELANGQFVRRLIAEGLATAVHDVSDGGILVALAEMALASGRGLMISPFDIEGSATGFAFGEDQSRYLVATDEIDRLTALAAEAGINAVLLAVADNPARLKWHSARQGVAPTEISLADLRAAHEGFFPKLMGADAALA